MPYLPSEAAKKSKVYSNILNGPEIEYQKEIDFLKQQLESFENITFLDKRHPGEDICYFDYELIINFFSSIILDIIEKNYPKSNILTVGVWGKPRVSFDTELKYYNIRKFKKLTFFK